MAIFVSYSRKDVERVRRLHAALLTRQREIWIDWEGIPPSADWMREIEAAIDSSEAFVFVLSPDSLQSQVCARELDHAVAQHKRLLPVVVRDIDSTAVPPALAKLNWVYLRDVDSLDAGLELLVQAIDTDLDWVAAHTRLIVRSREWEARAFDASLLLRGADLTVAERWLALGPDKQPPPTAAQTRYIIESRRRATRRRLQLLAGVAVSLVVMAVLGTLTFFERHQAGRQETIAVARRLAAAAERLRDQPQPEHAVTTPLERSLQLATEAVRRLGTLGLRSLDADLALRRALALAPQPVIRLQANRNFYDRDQLLFTPDDQLLAIGREPALAMRWNLRTGEAVAATEPRVEHDWWSLHLDPTGRWVAFSSGSQRRDATIELRNTRDLETVARWSALPGISSVAVGPDGTVAASLSRASSGGETRVWPAFQLQPAAILPYLVNLTFSADGRWLAGSTDDAIALWPVAGLLAGRAGPTWQRAAQSSRWLQFIGAGERLLTIGGEPEQLSVRAVNSGQVERELQRDLVQAASPNGRMWLERKGGYAVNNIIDVDTGAVLARLPADTPDAPFAWSSDGASLALVNGEAIDVWRPLLHGSASDGIEAGVDAFAFAFSADEQQVTTLHRRGQAPAHRLVLARWALAAPGRHTETDAGAAPSVAAFSADGGRLALGAPGPLRVLDAASGRELYAAAARAPAAAVALSGDGRHAASIGADGALTVLDVDAVRVIAQADKAASSVDNLLAISADGSALAAVNADGNFRFGARQSVRRWRADAIGQVASQPIGQKTSGLAAKACALSSSGDAVAINTSGSTLRVRDTASGRELAVVDEAGDEPLCAFSADGRLLATTGVDATLRIWDVSAREELARMELPAAPRALAFSPTGRYVAALDARGLLRYWPLRTADLVAQACSRLRSNMAAADWARFTPEEAYRATCDKLPTAADQRQ